jgi:hypothetical protein
MALPPAAAGLQVTGATNRPPGRANESAPFRWLTYPPSAALFPRFTLSFYPSLRQPTSVYDPSAQHLIRSDRSPHTAVVVYLLLLFLPLACFFLYPLFLFPPPCPPFFPLLLLCSSLAPHTSPPAPIAFLSKPICRRAPRRFPPRCSPFVYLDRYHKTRPSSMYRLIPARDFPLLQMPLYTHP